MPQTGSSDQSSGLSLMRDYGLGAMLLAVAGALLWSSTRPGQDEAEALERERVRMQETIERQRERLDSFEALDSAGSDPILLERLNREYFGSLLLPEGETLIDPEASGGESTIPQD